MGGCPLGAVVTTAKIAQSLVGKVHFNTFGGNPVVTAMGKAVLEVIEREKLQENALRQGTRIKEGLEQLKAKHRIIGDVRGKGLLLGVEMVKDRATKEPAKAECAEVLERAREMGLLLGKGGKQRLVPVRDTPCARPVRAGFRSGLAESLRHYLRMRRAFILQLVYVLALGAVVYLAWPRETRVEIGSPAAAQSLFNIFFLGQFALVALMAPSYAAGSLTGEKERKTYELLISTPLEPGAVLFGKLLSALFGFFE